MRVIFLHQNFPAQFLAVATALSELGRDDPIAVIPHTNDRGRIIPCVCYSWRKASSGVRASAAAPYVDAADRAGAVADALLTLKRDGLSPDLVIGHGGWGETLFVRDVWPDVPILLHAEFFHRPYGLDVGFDLEIAAADPFGQAHQVRARSVVMLQGLVDATLTHLRRCTPPKQPRAPERGLSGAGTTGGPG